MKKTKLFLALLLMLFSVFSYAQTCSGTANIPPNGTFSINGVTVTSTSTGFVSTFGSAFTSCSNVTTSANALWVGQNPASPQTSVDDGAWQTVLTFSKPINNIVIVLTATGQPYNEKFYFMSNGGTVSIASTTNCYTTISGNSIFSGAGASGTGGGGIFQLSAPAAFTTLTMSGLGGQYGALLGVCSASITPAPCVAGNAAPDLQSPNMDYFYTIGEYLDFSNNYEPPTNQPAGTTVTVHTGTPATDANKLADTDSITTGITYYVAFHDAVGSCYSPTATLTFSCMGNTTAPPVQDISNVCPATTANLYTAFTPGSLGPNQELRFYTNNTHSGTPLTHTEVLNAGAGTYYVFVYDQNGVAGCWSPVSDPIIVTINTCGMPITFGGINAEIVNGKLSVNWTSLTETNNDHYEIEASTDGTNFTKIGAVVSKAKDGNSGAVLDYEFTTQADALALKLGISLMLISGIGIGFAFKRRSHKLLAMGIAMGLTVIAVSCNKGNDVSAAKDGKLFIRIAQVDKDGTKQYSKTIQAVKK